MSKSIEDRLWAKVQKTDSCWLWTGTLFRNGYGSLFNSKASGSQRNLRAHRVSYELVHGPIPEGFVVDHLCSNRACVNPAHLQAVSNGLNIARGVESKLKRCDSGNRFRNVYRCRRRWAVQIQKNGRRIYGGLFADEEVAAMQVNVLSTRHFPGFRAFNPVEMG